MESFGVCAKVGKFHSRKRRIHGWLIHPFFLSLLHFPFFLSLHTLLNSIPSLFLLLLPLESQEIFPPLPSSSSSFRKLSFVVIGYPVKRVGAKKRLLICPWMKKKRSFVSLRVVQGLAFFFTLQSTQFPAFLLPQKKGSCGIFSPVLPGVEYVCGNGTEGKKRKCGLHIRKYRLAVHSFVKKGASYM